MRQERTDDPLRQKSKNSKLRMWKQVKQLFTTKFHTSVHISLPPSKVPFRHTSQQTSQHHRSTHHSRHFSNIIADIAAHIVAINLANIVAHILPDERPVLEAPNSPREPVRCYATAAWYEPNDSIPPQQHTWPRLLQAGATVVLYACKKPLDSPLSNVLS